MGLLNVYYRAFKEYRKHTLKDKGCLRHRVLIKNALSEEDKLEAVRTTCIIDEEWVRQIEEGLPFVEKAIAEERQFIKNEGEVLDIEKVKRVSKDSVEHLARHSDLITHVPKDGGDILPDKLYMVERLSDYAVYENRFLYMMLRYLRDFIDLRLKKIKELGNTYIARTVIKRDVRTSSGKISYESSFVEDCHKDPYSVFDKDSIEIIGRIESCQHWVSALLSKPLMVIVSKTPMLKPPITKTNILKMNTKFKNSVALYEYLAAYEGDGYEIKEIKKSCTPFSDELSDELSEIIIINSFLTYAYGNELLEKLKREYELEEKEREEKERVKLLEKIEQAKQRLQKQEISLEEYVLNLESGIENLRQENVKLKETEKKYDVLFDKHNDLKNEKLELNKKIADVERENRDKANHIEFLNNKHQGELDQAEERRVSDLNAQAELFGKREKEITDEFNQKLDKAEEQRKNDLSACQAEADNKYGLLQQNYDSLEKTKSLVQAQLHALQGERGLTVGEDFSSIEKFEELEKEFVAFYELFEEKWKQAKKQIRKDVLWKKFKKTREKI